MLVGREPERREIERRLASARAGSSTTLVVAGEAGIGKTTMLAEAQTLATDMHLLRAAGTEAEQDLPFAGLSQLLRPLLPLLDRIPEPQSGALARALALRPGRPGDRFAVAAATLSLVCRAAEDTPLLIVVDDLHQLDRPSVDALLFVARRLLTDSAVVLLGVRTGEGVDDLVADLDHLALTGLGEQDCGALVARRALTAAQLARLHEFTGGNPLAVLEMSAFPDLLDAGSERVPVPRLIARAFAARVRALSEPARTALLVAAAAGDVDLATVARACARSGSDLAALAEAERVRLVDLDGDRVAFRHPLLRAAVYQSAEPAMRRAAHRAVAESLAPGDLDRRAWQLSEAALGPDAAVAARLERSGDSSRDRGAYAVAAGRFERAARLSVKPRERVRRLTAAGEAAWLGGLSERALTLLGEAALAAADDGSRTRAIALKGAVSARSGSLVDARDLLLEAADRSAGPDPDEATLLLAEVVYTCFYLGDSATVTTAVHRLDALAERTVSARARMLGNLASGMGLIILGDGVEGATRIRRADAAAASGVLAHDARWLPWLLMGPIWLRESGEARTRIDAVVDDARERAALGTLPFLLFHAARDDATTDRWAAAEASFREAIGLARETGQRTDEGAAMAGLAWVLARQGREEETRTLAEEAELACRRSDLNLGRSWLQYALGDLEAGLGNTAQAIERYRSQQALVARLGITDPDLSPSAELVECLARVGQGEAAAAEARDFEARAAAKGQPWSWARAHRALAIAGIDPDTHFCLALAVSANSPDSYEHARTELAYGAYLRRARKRVEARVHLRSALTAFNVLAATPWAEATAAELAATGVRVQRRTNGQVRPLTPQEFQIAKLLAEGRKTREAAAALFLSPKTVEYHLRHAYIKLGISSRAELAQRLAADPELSTEDGR
jgi:DNA-binding CsgD family transcriptional regulator